ncbi:MAG: DUF4389 domain-containing protein [Nakamurella sp.]
MTTSAAWLPGSRPGTASWAAVTPPAVQPFWSVSAGGSGPQEVRFSALGSNRVIVVMNSDGCPVIGASVVLAVTAPFVLPSSVVVIGLGILLALLAGLLIRVGVKGGGAGADAAPLERAAFGLSQRGTSGQHPVALEARLEEGLSRWRWLVKWLLAVPHLIVLAFLWPAFLLVTTIAGVSILFTGVYPRSLFEFTTGVLRCTCRVSYYAFHGGMGTDVYPPFSPAAEPWYPITLDIHYPARLSSGLVLVKWWLLALPQYLVVGLLVGNWFGWTGTDGLLPTFGPVGAAGVLGILVVASGVLLLVTGRYPRSLYDLVIGLNRWIFRVAAYACLMTDVYPPFRLDQGGSEPRTVPPVTPSGGPRLPQPVLSGS